MGGRYPIAVLIAMLIAATHVSESEAAALSGGSRLIFYYTSRSIAHPDAGAGATTIVSITNHSSTTPARVIAWVRRADCTSFGFFERVVGVNETWRFVPADLAPPGEAGEGWVDAYALDPASRLPMRWDQLSGKATLLDFGEPTVRAVTYAAAALFSDDPDRASGANQGQLIADHASPRTWGLTTGRGDFWGYGGPLGVGHRLVIIGVAVNPGGKPVDFAPGIAFYTVNGVARTGPGTTAGCMLSGTLAELVADIGAAFPTTGGLDDGGNVAVTGGAPGNKGFVGLLFEYAQSAPVLAVSPIEHALTQGDAVHE